MKEHINEIYKGMRPWIVGDKRLTQEEMFDALERTHIEFHGNGME